MSQDLGSPVFQMRSGTRRRQEHRCGEFPDPRGCRRWRPSFCASAGSDDVVWTGRRGRLGRSPRRRRRTRGWLLFRSLAKELGVTLLIGSLAIRAEREECANRSFLIGPDGGVVAEVRQDPHV